MAAKKTAKKTAKKSSDPKKTAAKTTTKRAAKKAAKKSAKGRRKSEPPGVKPQSGKAAGGAPPFATANGKPTNSGGAPRNLQLVSQAPPIDQGGPGWDIDQTETPKGGTVTKADPPTNESGGGGLGNGGNARPFKNLR